MRRPVPSRPGRGNSSPLVEFLRRELAPTPGRLGATVRLTLACTAATVPIMIHHIPHALVVMIVMYLISREDTTATLLGSVLSVIALTFGFALALLTWHIALETAAWRIAFVFLFAAGGLYIGRIVVLGAIGTAIGVPATMAMVLPDVFPVPDTEAMTEFVLWLWWCVVLGLAINLGVQLLLSPGDPLRLLRRALVERLRAVADSARSVGGLVAVGSRPSRPSLTALAVAGPSEMLALLKTASLRHAWARQHRAELGALVSLIDQLVTAAAALEASGLRASGDDTRARLERVATECESMARALVGRSAPWDEGPRSVELPSTARAAAIPALAAMERVLSEIALAMPRAGSGSPQAPATVAGSAPAPKPARKMSLLVPDAFSNPEYVRSAIRGGLACLICYLIF